MGDIIEEVYAKIFRKEKKSEMSFDATGKFKKIDVKLSIRHQNGSWEVFASDPNDNSLNSTVSSVGATADKYENAKKYFDKMVEKYNLTVDKRNIEICGMCEDLKNDIFKAELLLRGNKYKKLLSSKNEQAVVILVDCMNRIVDLLKMREEI